MCIARRGEGRQEAASIRRALREAARPIATGPDAVAELGGVAASLHIPLDRFYERT